MFKVITFKGDGVSTLWTGFTENELNNYCRNIVDEKDSSNYYLVEEENGRALNARRLDYYCDELGIVKSMEN